MLGYAGLQASLVRAFPIKSTLCSSSSHTGFVVLPRNGPFCGGGKEVTVFVELFHASNILGYKNWGTEKYFKNMQKQANIP